MRNSLRCGLARWSVFLLLFMMSVIVHADAFEQSMAKQYGFYPDFAANLRVQYIGHRLALAAGLPNLSFKIFNDKDLNAMALPDGRVFITSRMATVTPDDELAFVIGHEITHVKEQHAKHQSERATGGAILGAILIGVLGGNAHDIRLGADIAGGLTYGHYSRKDEYSADAGGVRLMYRCGYNPKHAAAAMQRLIDLYGRGDASTPVLGWFATHPDSKSRKDRILKAADELSKKPPTKIVPPFGVDVQLDHSAEHARGWAHTYLSILLASYGEGRAVALEAPQYPIHAMTPPPSLTVAATTMDTKDDGSAGNTGNKKRDSKDNKDKQAADKDVPLLAVSFIPPHVPAGYRVTVFLQQVPAARAATIDAGEGTAVKATVHWVQVSSGFSGDCVAIAQSREKLPWMAAEQLKSGDKIYELDDGKDTNIEGTLEATALRRASMAFAEIMEADGPVHHDTPVSVPINTNALRPNDYIYVVRDNMIVAEVCVDRAEGKKQIIGTVLWGIHTWKKTDRFFVATD